VIFAPRQASASEEKPSSSGETSNPNHRINSLEKMPRINPRLETFCKAENAEPGDRQKQNTNDNTPKSSHSFIAPQFEHWPLVRLPAVTEVGKSSRKSED
jgi:hypothetical protein